MQRRTILITGAGSGLGRGMALSLADHGHAILAADVRADAAEETAALVWSAGHEA